MISITYLPSGPQHLTWYLGDRRCLDEQGIGITGVGTRDKTTSVQPTRKSFFIELIGLLMGDAIGPKKQSCCA
jgi:hypothetical protein